MRKSGSQFDQVCNFINSLPIGYEYTSKQLRNTCESAYPGRLGYIHNFLRTHARGANVIKRVARGKYEVLARIPDFVTHNMLEANYGFTKENPKYQQAGGTEPRYILRGKKWKAGEPNPNIETPIVKLSVSASERLDGLMTIKNETDFTDENETKYIYKYGSGVITKHRVHKTYFTAGKIGQTESLIEALINISDLTGPTPQTIAEEMLEEIEAKISINRKVIIEEKAVTVHEPLKVKPLEVKIENKLISIEDIRGKEVYWINRGEMNKGTIVTFHLICEEDSAPRYGRIEVDKSSNGIKGGVQYFDALSELYLSKKELHDAMTSMIEAL